MTSLLACRLANRIAAFAPVSGSYYAPIGGCHPSRPASILEIHGTGDSVVPYEGNPAIGLIGSDTWTQAWAERDACVRRPEMASLGNGITTFTWTGCGDGVTVVHYRILNGTHVWPGSSSLKQVVAGDMDLQTSALIWGFFKAHPLSSVRTRSVTGLRSYLPGKPLSGACVCPCGHFGALPRRCARL
jgi:polyhydroxybutyrate depolymerase